MQGKLKHLFNGWSAVLIGRAEDHTLEHRTARVACFLATSLSFISLIINFNIGASTALMVANAVYFIIFLLIYLYIGYKGKSNEAYWLIVTVCNATFSIAYINDEGAVGPTMYFWMFLVMFVSIAGGTQKKYMLALTMINISVMYAIEWFNPVIIHYHETRADSFVNIFLSVILCSIFGYTWVNTILTNYFKERDKVLKQKAEIERQKELIEDLSNREREINEMRLNFFTNLSHEFRTPLSLIYVTMEKLRETDPDDNHERARHYNILYKYTGQLNQLVDEALEFRKLDSGKVNIEITKNDIVSFAHDVTNSFVSLAETKSVQLKFSSGIPSLDMGFDVKMIEKVMYNLLSNAIKFTPQCGCVSVNVAQAENIAEISIEDTGIGISKEYTEQIFKPFYQVPGTKQGTGIGLALTHEYVKLHQGDISVMTELGKGSRFIIRLPVDLKVDAETNRVSTHLDPLYIRKSVQTPLPEIPSEKSENAYLINAFDKSILIVEDNEDIVAYLSDYLSGHYQINTARNGADGFDKALMLQPDLVISDVMMPVMYGTDLCHKLKTQTETSHIPVILLTARTSSDHKIEGFEIGADEYITKPFDQKLLLARINNLIASREKLKKIYSSSIRIDATEITTNPRDKEFLEKVIALVECNLDDPSFDLDILADNMNMSRSTFYRKIKALTNESGDDFMRSIRFKKAAYLLTRQGSITEISYALGFSDPKYFSKSFKKYYGCTPSRFVKENEVKPQLSNSKDYRSHQQA